MAIGCGRDGSDGAASPHARQALPARPIARLAGEENEGAAKLRLSAQLLEEHPLPLSAKVRQTLKVMGHEMRGVGEYYQMPNPAGDGEVGVLSRMDLRLQIHDRTATWTQVCDGRYLWTETKVPDEEKTLASPTGVPGYSTRLDRIDVAEAAEALALPRGEGGTLAGALSGLPHLLRTLAGVFDFAPPCAIRIGTADVWLIEGRWNPAVLADLLPEQAAAARLGEIDLGLLPPRIPDRVKVYLGQNRTGPWLGDLAASRAPPPDLFAFRIEYSRQDPDTGDVHPILNLEIDAVRFDDGKLFPDRFAFKSGRKHRNTTPRFVRP